jgi:hypothetical protein
MAKEKPEVTEERAASRNRIEELEAELRDEKEKMQVAISRAMSESKEGFDHSTVFVAVRDVIINTHRFKAGDRVCVLHSNGITGGDLVSAVRMGHLRTA